MLTLHQPYKLERKVMSEKSGINKHVQIKRTRDIKITNIKLKISVFISILTSILFAYGTIIAVNLNTDILKWDAEERLIFFLLCCAFSFPIWFYCSNHNNNDLSTGYSFLKISYLSQNWFKKLLSLIIIIFSVMAILCLILSFCFMSFNFSQLSEGSRFAFIIIAYFLIIVFILLAHHNELKFLLRV